MGDARIVKEQLRCRGYVRYMDDMALWAETKRELQDDLAAAEVFLGTELGLALKAAPYLNRTEHGLDFLGCRLYRGTWSSTGAAGAVFAAD